MPPSISPEQYVGELREGEMIVYACLHVHTHTHTHTSDVDDCVLCLEPSVTGIVDTPCSGTSLIRTPLGQAESVLINKVS